MSAEYRHHEQRLADYLRAAGVAAEQRVFEHSCHSVSEAAETAGIDARDIIKSICMIGAGGELIVAVVKGEDRASTSRVARCLGIERPRTASPEEVQAGSGYPCGGTPPFGFEARFLVDPRVLECAEVWGGGGSPYSLVRVASQELLRACAGTVARVRK